MIFPYGTNTVYGLRKRPTKATNLLKLSAYLMVAIGLIYLFAKELK